MLLEVKKQYPNLLIEISFEQLARFDENILVKLQLIDSKLQNQLAMGIRHEQALNLSNFEGNLRINRLKLDYQKSESLSIHSLSKFKIQKEFQLSFENQFEVIQSSSKCESPNEIVIYCQYPSTIFSEQVLNVLNGFCKYENIKMLELSQQHHNNHDIYSYQNLCQKISTLPNLTQLTIPLPSYEGIGEDLIEMLMALKKLTSINLYSVQPTINDTDSDVVQKVIEYAIDCMNELRLVEFILENRIQLCNIDSLKRANPLNIRVILKRKQIHYLYDIQFGLKLLFE